MTIHDVTADRADRGTTRPVESGATWRHALPVVALAVIAFVAALVMHHFLYRYGSGDRDEAVYRYQADMLRDGRFSVPVEQFQFYRPWLSDLYEGRLVMPFTVPWVAVLAVSGVVFGSTAPALGLTAAALCVGTYLFTHALIGRRDIALVGTALVSFSPFVLSQSGTYLNYVLALTLELFAAWTLLRGIRAVGEHASTPAGEQRRRPAVWLVASGVLWATAVWCRPLDGVLVGLPFAGWALYELLARRPAAADGPRGLLRRIGPPIGWLVIGAVPVVAGILVTNRLATGTPFAFPVTAQSGGAAQVGWGPRGIFRGELTVDYTVREAAKALRHNLTALPTWLIGSYLAVPLSAYGAWQLRRQDRAATVLLVAFSVVTPVGYLGWFASVLTVPGAVTGIGPHYYLPSVVPLAVLAAVGGRDLWDRRPPLAAAAVGVAALLTVAFVVPKVERRLQEAEYDERVVNTVDRALDARGDRPALVVLPPVPGTDGIMRYLDEFSNQPDLSGPVVYALDRGPGLFDLLDEQPDRVPFRVTRELRPGGDLAMPDPVVQPIVVVSGPAVEVQATITSTTGDPVVAATIESGGKVVMVELDDEAEFGRRYEVTWRLTADGVVEVTVDGETRVTGLKLPTAGEIGIGVASGADLSLLSEANPSRGTQTFPYRRNEDRGTIAVSTATADAVDFGGADGGSLPIDVSDRLSLSFAAP